MVLFVLFNGGGLSEKQWKENPFGGKKTNFLTKLKKYGNIYTYTPIFYNYNKYNNLDDNKYGKDIEFNIEDTDLENHCELIYNEIKKLDDFFILISHSRGHMMAYKFAIMYEKKVKAVINIDGGYTKNWYKSWLGSDKLYHIKKIKDKQLKSLFENIKNNVDITETIKVIDRVVKFNMFKQFSSIETGINCDIYIFNNILPNDSPQNIDKFEYNNDMIKNNKNVKSFYYYDKDHFLYYDVPNDIIDVIKKYF